MNKIYQSKTLDLKALDVDHKKRQVKIAIAELETIDRDKEVFNPLAFDKTIRERGPRGTNEIWHMIDHGSDSSFGTPSLEKALSKFIELGREGKYITGVSQYKDSWLWREVAWPLYEAGDINQHSVGFSVVGNKIQKSDYSEIPEVSLWEGSAVLWGANPNTPTQEVVKSLLKTKKVGAADRIEWIVRSLKEGKYAGDMESLLFIELKQLQQFIINTSGPSVQDTQAVRPRETSLVSEDEEKIAVALLKIKQLQLT